MKHYQVLALSAVVAGIMLWGCSNSTGTGPAALTTTEMIGKWVFNSLHETGTTTMHLGIPGIPDSTFHVDSTVTLSGGANYAQLYSDMTYASKMPAITSTGGSSSDTGSWSLSGSNLRLISTAGDTTNLSVSVSGNNGTFVNTTSERMDLGNGAYVQTNMTATVSATKQ
ncbi:MAG TPA: hypothetical protein VLX68_11360 [Chitinivibrionales bacterium]|nr:hypothetical protein [Chitinivibrionales bacterium]